MIGLKVKNLHIQTGNKFIAVMNAHDAKKYDWHEGDRIRIASRGRFAVAILDTISKGDFVRAGTIGFMEELDKHLGQKDGATVNVRLEPKPDSVKYIHDKLHGVRLSKAQINSIIRDIVDNKLSDIELTYFVAACYSNAMDAGEVADMTRAMVSTGETLGLKRKSPILDKHCIGGVANNRTTMIIVPILASLGYTIPKTSSRSITSAAGTADTMEVLCNVSMPIYRMRRIVEKTNCCIVWGGSLNLAPADDKIINVEKPMDMDSDSQLIASIMSKKHSVGATHILIDIPVGRGAKIDSVAKAKYLEKQFLGIGKKLGMKIKVIITDGSAPIGSGIGPALEARDAMWILMRDRRAPKDLEEKSLYMAEELLRLAGARNPKALARRALEDGSACRKMMEIISMQGARINSPDSIRIGMVTHDVLSQRLGRLRRLDNAALCKIARVAGAPVDPSAGIYLCKHVGDSVRRGERIYTVYSSTKEKMHYAMDVVKNMKSYEIK